MSPIAEAIQAWQQKKLGGSQLMRTVVAYAHWKFPISEEAAIESLVHDEVPRLQYVVDEQGLKRLLLWSTSETYTFWLNSSQTGAGQHFIETTGGWIFSLPLGDMMDEVVLDPLSPQNLVLAKEQIGTLALLAAAMSIEKDLADLRTDRTSDAAVVRVREHPSYLVAVAQSAEGQRLVLAPDTQERALAAVFTADDAFYAFLPEARAGARANEQVLRLEMTGGRLFQMLADQKLEGIVFNCSGPTRPVAFAAAFSQVVLEA